MMINGINKIIHVGGLGYLASPYSKYKAASFDDRYTHYDRAAMEIAEVAGRMLMSGMVVMSPIAGSHYIAKALEAFAATKEELAHMYSHEFWMPIDERYFNRCDYGVIAMLSNWEHSDGMSMEIVRMSASGKQVLFYDPSNSTLYNIEEIKAKYPEQFETFVATAVKNKPHYLHSSVGRQMLSFNRMMTRLSGEPEIIFPLHPPDDEPDDDGGGGAPQ